jgi:hypothetical protein
MISDEWTIKKVKYDGTVSIVFTNGDIAGHRAQMGLWDGDEHVD